MLGILCPWLSGAHFYTTLVRDYENIVIDRDEVDHLLFGVGRDWFCFVFEGALWGSVVWLASFWFCSCWEKVSRCSPSWLGTHYLEDPALKSESHLPPSPRCWNFRHVLQRLAHLQFRETSVCNLVAGFSSLVLNITFLTKTPTSVCVFLNSAVRG